MGIKTKIYLTVAVWLAFCGAMFGWGLKILDSSNRKALTSISGENSQLQILQNEQESYRQAQKDLQDMAQQPYQPDNFFSSDLTLVKEIEALEETGTSTGVNLTLGGISGTIDTVPKAKTQGELFLVPYSISVSGRLDKVVNFIETLENLDFITTLNSLSISSSGDGTVSASMAADFYIHKSQTQ